MSVHRQGKWHCGPRGSRRVVSKLAERIGQAKARAGRR